MEKNCFEQEIFDNLPDLLKPLVNQFEEREKDIVLISSIGVLSNCIPNVFGYYNKKKYYPHLYIMIIAPPASGKGSMNNASILIEEIHQVKMKESRSKIKTWKKKRIGAQPKLDVKVIPGNVSSAKFYSHLENNEHGLLIFESEADSISIMLKQDWGNFSDILRKAFHHEKISISRQIDDKFIEVTSPKLAMVVSGTEGQVKPLVLSKENGLFSRFLYYYFNDGVEWKDVTPNEEYFDDSLVFEEASAKILKLYEQLEKLPEPIEFKFTSSQWEKLNSTLETATSIFNKNGNSSLTSTVFRSGLILFRIAMVLTVIRNMDSIKEDEVLTCMEEDFETAHYIVKFLLDHALLVSELFQQEKYGLSVYELNVLSNLPQSFQRKDAIEIGKELDIKSRTMDNYLRKWKGKGVLEITRTGFYRK